MSVAGSTESVHLHPYSQIIGAEEKSLVDYTESDHEAVHAAVKAQLTAWKDNKVATDYVAYGCQNFGDEQNSFKWDLVPFSENKPFRFWNWRVFQQLGLLFRISFGSRVKAAKGAPKCAKPVERKDKRKSAFCKAEIIKKQRVFEGDTCQVLYDYRPIGLGKKKLHMLVLPKEQRVGYEDMTDDEAAEFYRLSQGVAKYMGEKQGAKKVHLFYKKGYRAGQQVPHIFCSIVGNDTTKADWWSKITMLVRISGLFKRPIPQKQLEEAVKLHSSGLRSSLAAPGNNSPDAKAEVNGE